MTATPSRAPSPTPAWPVGPWRGAKAADSVVRGEFGKMVSARGVAPACDLSLVDIDCVLGPPNVVDVARHYDTERYHFKGIGM